MKQRKLEGRKKRYNIDSHVVWDANKTQAAQNERIK